MSGLRWNKAFALEQTADDTELLQELINIFKDSCASDCALIRSGISRLDGAQVASAAHSIKGAAASLGIEAIREIALAIEMDGKEGKIEAAAQRFPELEGLLFELKNL
ncbi:MAG: Hpt domain-containing protein [Desulfobulbaceae bacterium]|nr:MAG: Hpt domain-containing protein [Desulfobulbaceae bacterium]